MQDENYVGVSLLKDMVTEQAVPILCDYDGVVLAISADDGSVDLPIVPPVVAQDENYTPIALGTAPDGTTRPLPASYSGILITTDI